MSDLLDLPPSVIERLAMVRLDESIEWLGGDGAPHPKKRYVLSVLPCVASMLSLTPRYLLCAPFSLSQRVLDSARSLPLSKRCCVGCTPSSARAHSMECCAVRRHCVVPRAAGGRAA